MKQIRTAVIGTGFMGAAHIEALRRVPGVEVVGVGSRVEERAKQLAERYGITKAFGDWRRLIQDDEIEVIHNCTPNNLHFEINKAAISAGKHIVSEKPLTINSRESAELVKLAKEKGVVNAINFNYRFYPLIQQAKRTIADADFGEIYYAHGHYVQDWLLYETDYNWRLESRISGESRAIADIGSHWCDLVQFVTGMKIKKVFADLVTVHRTRKRPKAVVETFKGKETERAGEFDEIAIDTEDAGSVLFHFENGTRGVLTVSQVSAGRKNRFWFEIDGGQKALAWDQEEPNQLWIGHREKPNEIVIKDPSLLDEEIRRYAHYPGGHPEGYPDGPKNLFINVYDFIRSGKDPKKEKADFPTFEDGHLEIKLVEAVLKSHREGRWVEVAGGARQ